MDHVDVKTIMSFGYRFPRFHKDILSISLMNYKQIKKTYLAVLGLKGIDHLSVNIVNPEGEMVFLSSTPYTGINVCGCSLWKYDVSIHPNTYENKNFYWWEDCYCEEMKMTLKLEKETKNNLGLGFVIAKKIDKFYIMYSFATKEQDPYMKEIIKQYKKTFIDMGDYCYSEIKSLYQRYAGKYEAPPIHKLNFPKSKQRS